MSEIRGLNKSDLPILILPKFSIFPLLLNSLIIVFGFIFITKLFLKFLYTLTILFLFITFIKEKLFKQFIAFFESKNIHLITAFAWKSKEGFNMEGIFKKHNFPIVKTIENYWKLDSIEKKYGCPSCGDLPPCLCTAVIFSKTI